MSVATEFAPTVSIPARARLAAPAERAAPLAGVRVLYPPSAPPAAAALRLTRRGIAVLALAVAALGVGLIWLARASAPAPASASAVPHAVTVRPGDTLWSIATAVAPGRDPRAEVVALERRNHLTGVDLLPGQVLRVP